jgi:para-aminobenzoate synthetase/4-amino-4-deoxychorismate lyase
MASRPDCEDVLLWNDRGEVTETSIANVVVWMSDGLTTPALDAGLLPGILRAEAIREGHVREGSVLVADLAARPRMWLVSAVRGWREAVLTP